MITVLPALFFQYPSKSCQYLKARLKIHHMTSARTDFSLILINVHYA